LNQTAHIHQDLIADSIKGSNKARYQLYQLYSKAMFNVCYRMMNNREDAEDMLQEAFIQAFQKLNTFRNEEPEEALYTTENVIQAMNQLSEGGRIVFSLYLLEGYDHGEIAQILNITESTSKTQYMRAKRRVQEIMKQTKSTI